MNEVARQLFEGGLDAVSLLEADETAQRSTVRCPATRRTGVVPVKRALRREERG
jgi:hypothetical protein